MDERQQPQYGSNKHKILISVVLVVFLLVLLHDKYLPFFGNYLIADDRISNSDAIFVFGGSIPNRIIEAVGLYWQGYSRLIIISKYPEPEGYEYLKSLGISYPEGHEINKNIAVEMGVPENNVVILPDRAGSTFEELVQLNGYLNEHNLKSIILVSSKSHTRRISIIFSEISGGKFKTSTRFARHDSYDPDHWWKDRNSLRQTIFEYQKLIHYLLADRKKIN